MYPTAKQPVRYIIYIKQGKKLVKQQTWVMVWNRPPARLCSPGSTTDATYSVPAAKTKSAPMTATMAPGNPKAQYGALGMVTANKRQASEDPTVPVTAVVA